MRTQKRLHYSLLCLLAAICAGCAASGSVQSITPAEPLGRDASMSVVVSAQDPDAGGYVMVLRNAIDQKLALQGFRMMPEGKPGSVEISAVITEVRRVSQASRILFGAFMGQAGMTVSVTLKDTSSDRVLGSFVAEGKSSGGTIFAGTTDQAVDQVATQVASYIQTSQDPTPTAVPPDSPGNGSGPSPDVR